MAHEYIIVGLGNPGDEYAGTHHNAGREAVQKFVDSMGSGEWESEKKLKGLVSIVKFGSRKAFCILPETFMNKSGEAVGAFFRMKKIKPDHIVVLHDDIDLPLGTLRIMFGRGSGGHKGVESVMRHLKTKEFIRIKIGVSPETPSGKTRKPHGDEKVVKFVLGKFKDDERKAMNKVYKKIFEALEMIVKEGRERAANEFN